jgi:hypothetical protein
MNAVIDQLVRHLFLMDSKGSGLTVTDVRELAFHFAEKNGLSHKFNLEKKWQGIFFE